MALEAHRILWMTLDPVHVGTGGYRLGRVDLTIAREPGTNLPKVPGTSLAGAARTYAAYVYGKVDCAGKGGETGRGHCGLRDCPVCYTFGYLKGKQSYEGTVALHDAHVLCAPVHSMAGPVWVASPGRLQEAGFTYAGPSPGNGATLGFGWKGPINLGWILLQQVAGQATVSGAWDSEPAWQTVRGRLVLVEERLFSHVVNSNLEVRTSVSIDPERGAAEEGALFTYEAIPRGTILWSDLTINDYRKMTNPNTTGLPDPRSVALRGLGMVELLGIGGMGTRGFGRMRILGTPQPLASTGAAGGAA
jgi:CRISPR-associated protein Cmr4